MSSNFMDQVRKYRMHFLRKRIRFLSNKMRKNDLKNWKLML